MFIRRPLKCGVWVSIIVRNSTKRRLQTTCFREGLQPFAGNFMYWHSPEEVFGDLFVMGEFLLNIEEMWEGQDFGTQSICISHTGNIGWESTVPIAGYESDDFERFDINRRSWGMRIKLSRRELLAPKTCELTIVCEFKHEEGSPVVIIHSLYPGQDIGELIDDVTNREQRVFFGWNHPGEQ